MGNTYTVLHLPKSGTETESQTIAYYYYEDPNGYDLDIDDDGKPDTKGYITSELDSAKFLQGTISTWYNAIRNICLVLMLSVLVYIGIRILLSSVASDKAKYQTMLKDWFVGLCLLFLMHYIMAFSVTMVDKLTDVVGNTVDAKEKYVVNMDHTAQLQKDLEEIGMEKQARVDENDPKKGYLWYSNLMGYLRLKAQMDTRAWSYIGEAIIFVVLVIFTVMFTVTYLKRLLYMAFLTIISPMVALTYCIDKINDGKAQGFDKWLKEYIFNLLIQPMHLLLYYILITSAWDFLGENVIYSMVAIAFMLPAEKMLRSLFGFEKAKTPPAFGPAAAMMASTGLNHLLHRGSKRRGGEGGGARPGEETSGSVPNPTDENKAEAFADEEDGTVQQRMLDADNEQFSTENWNPEEYEARARAANANDGQGMQYTDEELASNMGITVDELREMRGDGNSSQEQNNEQQSTIKQKEKKENPSWIRRKLHAGWAARKAEMRQMPRRFYGSIKGGKGSRKIAKMGVGALTGFAAGGLALATQMAAGNGFEDAMKVAGGAVAGGYAMGSGRIQNASSIYDNADIKDVYDVAYNKGNNKEAAMKDYVKNFKRDVKNRNYFEQKLGKSETEKMMNNGEIEEYLRNEIVDRKEIAAAHKLYTEGYVKDIDQAIYIAQLSQTIGTNSNHLTTKKQNEWKATIAEMAPSSIKDKKAFAERRYQQLKKYDNYKK